MRIDYVEHLNANLEAKAVYLEQVISMHEAQIKKLKMMAHHLRALASKDAADGDPVIDAKPFTPPLTFRRSTTATTGGGQAATAGERAVAEAIAPKQAAE